MTTLPTSMQQLVAQVAATLPHVATIFANTLANTYTTTLRPQPDGSVFVITGDIPAMWLRDSAAQVSPYLYLAKHDRHFADLIAGVVKRQAQYVLLDSYANAFNESDNGHCHNHDKTEMSGWIWERKFELDSLCAPLILAHKLWKATSRTDHLDATFIRAARLIIDTMRIEQLHEYSHYTFERLEGPASDTLTNQGRGNPVTYTGLVWSGFRPSDDACTYNYLIPANMMAIVALRGLAEMLPAFAAAAKSFAGEINTAIKTYGIVNGIYAYEVDGLGNAIFMDDANVPSLLAAPYMGYCRKDDPVYLATRRFLLSKQNPFFYEGKAANGIGSPHTPPHHIWPISLCIQSLTSTDHAEKLALLNTLLTTDAGTGLMHESFHKDDPHVFTRPWFAWANSLFAETVMDICGIV
jgi:uncharacterized protein